MSYIEATIHLKSGAHIVLPVVDVTIERNRMTHELQAMRWTYLDPEADKKLLHIDLSQVAAVTTIRKGKP